MGRNRRPILSVVYLLWTLVVAPCNTHGQVLTIRITAGTPVAKALQQLERPEFRIIFSTALVDQRMRVKTAPRSNQPVAMAEEILEAFGLTLREIAPSQFAVVRAAKAPASVPASLTTVLDEITVTASFYQLHGSANTPVELEGAELRTQPQLVDDALQSVQHIPGVAQSGFPGQAHIRGGEANETRVLLDGFPIREVFHLPDYQGPFSALDSSAVKHIDVYTGGFSARFGGRMSGILDIQSRDVTEAPQNMMGISTVNSSARVAGQIDSRGDLDGLLIGRLSNIQKISEAVVLEAHAPTFSDALGKLRWHLADGTTLSLHSLIFQDAHDNIDRDTGKTGHTDSRTRYAWIHAEQSLGERWQYDAWLGNSALASDRDGAVNNLGVAVGQVLDNRRADIWDASLRFHGQLGGAHELEWGGEWTASGANYNYQSSVNFSAEIAALFGRTQNVVKNAVFSVRGNNTALYLTDRWQVTQKLFAEIGVRAQRYAGLGLNTYLSQDPRVSLSFAPNSSTQIFASWGIFHQADEVLDLDVINGVQKFSSPQYSRHFIVGLQYHTADGISYRAEAYRKIQGLPRPRYESLLDPLSILPEFSPDRVLVAPSHAELHGVELSTLWLKGPLSTRLSYTWSQAYDDIKGIEVPRAWNQNNALSAMLQWHEGSWAASAALGIHDGWPSTPLLTLPNGINTLGVRNSGKEARYQSLDLRIAYIQPVKRGALQFTADAGNVLNHNNHCCLEFIAPQGANGALLFKDSSTWLPRIIVLGVRWDF